MITLTIQFQLRLTNFQKFLLTINKRDKKNFFNDLDFAKKTIQMTMMCIMALWVKALIQISTTYYLYN